MLNIGTVSMCRSPVPHDSEICSLKETTCIWSFVKTSTKNPQTLVRNNYNKYRIPQNKKGQLHSQESRGCNWMLHIFETSNIDTVMAVTTNTIKKGEKCDPVNE